MLLSASVVVAALDHSNQRCAVVLRAGLISGEQATVEALHMTKEMLGVVQVGWTEGAYYAVWWWVACCSLGRRWVGCMPLIHGIRLCVCLPTRSLASPAGRGP